LRHETRELRHDTRELQHAPRELRDSAHGAHHATRELYYATRFFCHATRELRHPRIAGQLLGAIRSAATVDALVVAQAVESGGAHILTGDREDLERLAASHPEGWIHPL